MTRARASVNGGYTRKTVSLPSSLVKQIDAFLAKHPGVSFSAFMSDAGEALLKKNGRKPRRRR